ncbi:hypothetical protein RhiJN_22554 [Ceratobasidium sp. AG-Ba]|nr:hypothetical protein RhiJN_22553 [Ceratobasidium sp. AG-Ba]QRV94536.1 hypothetical protein RhiJN_22554 [Ceratobasidium sp. AG-Ba]
MPVISVDQRVQALAARGANIVEHTTEPTAAESKRTGSDPLDQPVPDGFYRIIQVDENNTPSDASYSGKGLIGQEDFPVVMSQTPDLVTQFWKLTRQYGVKNGYTIVPVSTPGSSTPGLGGTAVNEKNTVHVKRSGCYPIWNVTGSEAVTYQENGKYVTLIYYRIYEVGSNRCWKTDNSQAVTIASATSGRPPASELYQIVVASMQQNVIIQSVDNISVRASDHNVVKRYYFGTEILGSKIPQMVSVQLNTDAHDQGWASNPEKGLWSWFELAIFTKAPSKDSIVNPGDIKKGPDGNPLTWISHRVGIESSFVEQSGPVFTKDHELWKHLSGGDYIGVLVCAQYPAWSLSARRGTLSFSELISEDNF